VTDEDLLQKGARLARRLASALQDADIEVISYQSSAVIGDHRGGTYAAATVTLSAAGADALVRKLTGESIGNRDPRGAVRAALNARHIGGLVNHDPDSGIVGLASLTERMVAVVIEATLGG
jgi:hypothetical protein